MNSFGLKHGFIPHGNRFPEGSSSDSSVKVEVAESEAPTPELLNEDEIAARYNMRVDRHPYSMYNSVTATVGLIDGDLKILKNGRVFRNQQNQFYDDAEDKTEQTSNVIYSMQRQRLTRCAFHRGPLDDFSSCALWLKEIIDGSGKIV